MGEYAEMAFEAEFYDWHDPDAEELAELKRQQQLARTTWKTREGRILAITDMESDHLDNTIRYLERNGSTVPVLMRVELAKRKKAGYIGRSS